MANNKVIANSGNPFTAATDEIAGIDYAKMKLFTSEEDSAEGIGDDDKGTQRALWVAPRARVVELDMPSAGLTTSATPYSIGDVIGTVWTLPNAVDVAGGSGKVRAIRIVDKQSVMTGITLWLASAAITWGTDNGPVAVSDVDVLKIKSSITLGFTVFPNNRIATVDSVVVPYTCDATSLFVYAQTNVAHNQFTAVTDLPIWFLCEKD